MAPTYKDFTWLTKKLQLCQFVISKSSSTDSAAHTLQHAFEKCHLNFLRHQWSDINLLTSGKLPPPWFFWSQWCIRVLRVQDPNQNILTVIILEHLFGRLNCKHKVATKKLSHCGSWNILNFPRFKGWSFGWVSHHPRKVYLDIFPRMNPWPAMKWSTP